MAVLDFQFSLNGLIFGTGTNFIVEDVDGFGATVRTTDSDRPNASGQTMGLDYFDARLLTFTVNVMGKTAAQMLANLDLFKQAWHSRLPDGGHSNPDISWKFPGQEERCLLGGRPRRIEHGATNYKYGLTKVVCDYYCPDPRMYRAVPRVIDLSYGAGNITLPNTGNLPAPVQWDVYGLVTNPGLIRSEQTRFDMATAIGNNDYYRVNTDAHTVVRASDSGNLYQTWAGTWLEVPAGGALFRAVGANASGSAKIRATYRDAFI